MPSDPRRMLITPIAVTSPGRSGRLEPSAYPSIAGYIGAAGWGGVSGGRGGGSFTKELSTGRGRPRNPRQPAALLPSKSPFRMSAAASGLARRWIVAPAQPNPSAAEGMDAMGKAPHAA